MAEHRIKGNGVTVTVPGGNTMTDVRAIKLPGTTYEKVDVTGLAASAARVYMGGSLAAVDDLAIVIPAKHFVNQTLTDGAIVITFPSPGGTITYYGRFGGVSWPNDVAPDGEVLAELRYQITNNNAGAEAAPTAVVAGT